MIALLRKLRRKLLSEGKLSKYLAYAVGEILLVVLGILIALQVNTWNLEQLDKIEEQATLVAISNEMEENVAVITGCQERLNALILSADSLRMLVGSEQSNLTIEDANWALGSIGVTYRCPIRTDVLDEFRNSGNLSMISDIDIRRNIGRWTTSLGELSREEDEWAREFSSLFYPYTSRWMSWEDFEYELYADTSRYYKSRIEYDPRPMLQELEYANLLALHYWRMTRIEQNIEQVMQISKEIKTQIGGSVKTE